MDELWVVRAGQVPYLEALEIQKRIEEARHAGDVPDVLLLLEHPPVFTKGRRTDPSELPMGEQWYEMQGIEIAATDRGGRVTYHGPGQLVAYPIVSLRPYGDDVHAFVRGIERVMIETLDVYGIEAQCVEGLTGVWTTSSAASSASRPGAALSVGQDGPRKIGSIGIHINNDLQPFEWIVPCGIEGVRMTSVTSELGQQREMGDAMTTLADRYAEVFDRSPAETTATELAGRIEGLRALAAADPAALR
jgi:lipoyl(octanoyl) transferase